MSFSRIIPASLLVTLALTACAYSGDDSIENPASDSTNNVATNAGNNVPVSPPALTPETTPTQSRIGQAATVPLTRPALPIEKIAAEQRLDEQTQLARQANFVEAMTMVEERQKLFAGEPQGFSLTGQFSQGGMLFGRTVPGSTVRLDGVDVMVGDEGSFALGFGRDSALSALLTITKPDGSAERHTIELVDRQFPEERIDGLDQSKVSGYTPAQLEKIGIDRKLKNAARANTHGQAYFMDGFDWPVTGRISGVFGSRRILNGEPKRPHSGVDVARPTGTPVRAPASGIVTLAQDGMYFEGGLILVDHGHWVESAFLHLSRIDVEHGQRVEKGDVIGAVGATGRVTGPHLHWSMRWMSRLVDPQLVAGEMPTQ